MCLDHGYWSTTRTLTTRGVSSRGPDSLPSSCLKWASPNRMFPRSPVNGYLAHRGEHTMPASRGPRPAGRQADPRRAGSHLGRPAAAGGPGAERRRAPRAVCTSSTTTPPRNGDRLAAGRAAGGFQPSEKSRSLDDCRPPDLSSERIAQRGTEERWRDAGAAPCRGGRPGLRSHSRANFRTAAASHTAPPRSSASGAGNAAVDRS